MNYFKSNGWSLSKRSHDNPALRQQPTFSGKLKLVQLHTGQEPSISDKNLQETTQICKQKKLVERL